MKTTGPHEELVNPAMVWHGDGKKDNTLGTGRAKPWGKKQQGMWHVIGELKAVWGSMRLTLKMET